jgi:hypothetical protein
MLQLQQAAHRVVGVLVLPCLPLLTVPGVVHPCAQARQSRPCCVQAVSHQGATATGAGIAGDTDNAQPVAWSMVRSPG